MIDGFAHFQLVVSNMICDCSPMTMEKPIVNHLMALSAKIWRREKK
jgi:hypothetical protein